jgi:predicted transcriptional regulator of viral defense system
MYAMTTTSQAQQALDLAFTQGMLRPRDLEKAGLSRRQVYLLCQSGQLRRVGRGLYQPVNTSESAFHSYALVAKRVPAAIFCLLSALSFHELTTQLSHAIWIAIPPRARQPQMRDVTLRVVRFSGAGLTEGVEDHIVDGVNLHITSAARTVVDCFKYRNKIGRDVAVEALRDAIEQRKALLRDIIHFAELRRVSEVMRPYLEFYQ